MTKTTLAGLMATLLAGSLALGAAGPAFARGDSTGFDPARAQERIEKGVDRALSKTDATAEQKKKIADILQAAMKDMKPFRDQRVENRKALEAAMEAPTIDPARVEQLRGEQMKIADASSKRFTQALIDAGNVLSPAQRQAFFKAWNERHGRRHG